MTELKDLTTGTVLIGILAIVVLVAIAVIGGFEEPMRDSTTEAINGVTVATNNSVTSFGSTYGYVSAVSGCVNATGSASLTSANYTVYNGGSTGGGFVLLDAGSEFVGWSVNCSSVTYKAENIASANVNIFLAGLAIFGTFVGVLVLAIIGRKIISMFQGKE